MCRHPLHTDPITPSSSCPLQLSALTASIVKSLEDPPRNYAEEADSFWSHIVDATPFDWIPQVIAELQALTVEEVQQAADRWVFDPNERSSVSVMLFGKPHLQELEALKTTTSTRTRTTTRSSLVVGEVAGKEGKRVRMRMGGTVSSRLWRQLFGLEANRLFPMTMMTTTMTAILLIMTIKSRL